METQEMKVELKQLSVDMGKIEYDMLQGIIDLENGFSNPAYNLSYEEYKEWLQKQDDISKGINLPEGWIPATTYFLYINDTPVGYGRVRHSSSEYLETVVGAGNLGYGISKQYRGKGYGNIGKPNIPKRKGPIGRIGKLNGKSKQISQFKNRTNT